MTTSASALDQGQRLGDVTPVAGRRVGYPRQIFHPVDRRIKVRLAHIDSEQNR